MFSATILTIPIFIFVSKYLLKNRNKPKQKPKPYGNSIDVSIYAYDSDVAGLDDVKAMYLCLYRETGIISGMEDATPIYSERFFSTRDNDRELGLITHSAIEVKRVTEKTIIYFFRALRSHNIKSESVRAVYDSISRGLSNNGSVVLRLSRSNAGDNDYV
jgi:hypothetical protein